MSTEFKKLVSNFISLTILQASNYVLPLLTVPYLVRVLGPEKYGLISFASAFASYFIILTDYGFVHTAPREIALNRDNHTKLSEIFSTVIAIKIGLLIISLLVYMIIVVSFNKFNTESTLYIASFLIVISSALFPTWFFQGIEEMKYITTLSILSKTTYTILVILIIKRTTDYTLVPIFSGISAILPSLASFYIIKHKYKIKFTTPTALSVKNELARAWHVFTGLAAVSFNYNTNAFILGIFTNNAVVGYFKASETLIRALTSLITPILQATYPYVSKIASRSKESAFKTITNILKTTALPALALSLLLFIYARDIVILVYGSKYLESITILRILSFIPFLVSVSSVLATLGLLAFSLNEVFSKITIISGAFNFILALSLVHYSSAIGVSAAMLCGEVIATILSIKYFKVQTKSLQYE